MQSKDWAVVDGMARANGEYVHFLDSDDWLKPQDNLEQLMQARQTDADVVVAGYEDYDADLGQARAPSLGRLRRLWRAAVR